MIVSRFLAKRRMAANVRPSFVGAWGLVLADAVLVAALIWLLYPPFAYLMVTLEIPTFMIVLALFLLVFIPLQAVLIVSSLWAAKSRWVDTDQPD